jgi:hypothetical protein
MFPKDRKGINWVENAFDLRMLSDNVSYSTHLRWCTSDIPRHTFTKVEIKGRHKENRSRSGDRHLRLQMIYMNYGQEANHPVEGQLP